MSTASVLSPPNASVPVPRIRAVVCRSVETAFEVLCRRRHETEVTVTRDDVGSADDPIQLRLRCSGETTMDAEVRVRHVGGNVYDVRCLIEGGASRQFTYGQSDRGAPTLSRAPELGRKLGTFLLNELERKVGRRHLRDQ